MFQKVGANEKTTNPSSTIKKVIPWPIAKHKENPPEEALSAFSIISEFLHPIKKAYNIQEKRGRNFAH